MIELVVNEAERSLETEPATECKTELHSVIPGLDAVGDMAI